MCMGDKREQGGIFSFADNFASLLVSRERDEEMPRLLLPSVENGGLLLLRVLFSGRCMHLCVLARSLGERGTNENKRATEREGERQDGKGKNKEKEQREREETTTWQAERIRNMKWNNNSCNYNTRRPGAYLSQARVLPRVCESLHVCVLSVRGPWNRIRCGSFRRRLKTRTKTEW